MRSIGEMARDSGLGVSALRFYDRAGVLVPARVDPLSGYRWYGRGQLEEARVLARLRRAGMPLADVRLVLAAWPGTDTGLARSLLQAHLRRLESGLSEARVEFSALRALLDHREKHMPPLHTAPIHLSVPAPALAAALDAVRFAVSTDPELPVLGGVLFDIDGDTLYVVATDRYRMAVARAAVAGYGGPRVQAVVPTALADAVRALLGGRESVRLELDGDRVVLEAGDRQVAGRRLDHDFPDYRRLVHLPAGRRALVGVPAFRAALETGPVHEHSGSTADLTVLELAAGGTVTIREDAETGPGRIAVNREFLLQALTAAAHDHLVLESTSPTAPLAIRHPDDEHPFSLLMPVRLED
ncbi:MerR family transcriptional regulator [Streptomyces sp. NPDC059168]|uniref:DNA polymerase III subunit beta family protein n=1 Tax=Streptomyces sp. NPDC059168 TaxID=3346753 RepID=UPI003688D2A2